MSPPVRDVATGELVDVGPVIDDAGGRRAFLRAHPDRRYAIAKRTLSHRELRTQGISNDA
jgi:hypothetical protein